ncbi:hypothetical protein [Paraflavitalea pollutisoli]|uniref:hypothetical protein n=1 Tax=Paraflavitalea pollutisoli TaxID=3034143 RepID=UPI0023EBAFE8|nr:hypothetical protein [Paraflavitalea sp. H1-2-19X]
MKRLLLSICLLATVLSVCAQEEWKEASKESQAYHTYSMQLTFPPFSLKKVQTLVKAIEFKDSENNDGTEILKQSEYLKLTQREKFTYHAIHAETYNQNCDVMPPIQDEHKKIFGQLSDPFGEYTWAERQRQFFRSNKDSVMAWIKESVGTGKRLGLNLKHIVVEINAREMIPFLISNYNSNKKDHDMLTVLMLLMKNNEYKVFMESLSYKKLYAPGTTYDGFLIFNAANEELIIKRATDFYNELPK